MTLSLYGNNWLLLLWLTFTQINSTFINNLYSFLLTSLCFLGRRKYNLVSIWVLKNVFKIVIHNMLVVLSERGYTHYIGINQTFLSLWTIGSLERITYWWGWLQASRFLLLVTNFTIIGLTSFFNNCFVIWIEMVTYLLLCRLLFGHRWFLTHISFYWATFLIIIIKTTH